MMAYAAIYFYGLVISTVTGLFLLLLSVFVVKLKRIAGKTLLVIGVIFLLPMGNHLLEKVQHNWETYNSMGPFFQAIYKNNHNKVRDLIIEGYDVNMCNMDAYPSTPLTFAIHNNCDIHMIRLLVENGADPNGKATNSDYPLLSAVISESTEAVQYLLEQGANVSLEGEDLGRQPICLATTSTSGGEVLEILLAYGANVNDASIEDVIRRGDSEQLRCLLEHGANPSWKFGSESLLELAERIGNKDIIDLLVQYGAVKYE